MQTQTQFDHSSKDVLTAIGVDKERLDFLIKRINQIGPVAQHKSEVIELAIGLCKNPAEVWALAHIMGEQEVCNHCPLKQLEKILKL